VSTRRAQGVEWIPNATGGIARLACNRLRKEGKDPTSILLSAGLMAKDVEDPKRRLRADAQVKFLELGATELQDDNFGFRLAQDYNLGEIGLVYYVMASSERLVDALANAERYCAINNEGVRLRVSADRALTIGLEYRNVDRHSDRHHAEFWVATLVRIVRALTGGRIAPRQIQLRHLRRPIPADIRSHLGCEVDYAAQRDEVSFAASIGSLTIVGADAYLNRLLLEYANDALGRHPLRRNTLRSQVEDHLSQLLPNGNANVSEVARRLRMSCRTLSRGLLKEGTTFSAVMRNLRETLAKSYLGEDHLPISEIAWLLGYQEVSSFSHAFTGWTGQTPGRFRASRR
jgi:AraC-like DNA-binding protein